jgi:folate-dependent tRNA-U54 methylase TrmFO/GidA
MYDDYEDDYVESDVTDEEYAELMSDIILERQEVEDFEGNDWYDSQIDY